jgi:acetyl-CoA carboxylase biotin carboxyl carrier protein
MTVHDGNEAESVSRESSPLQRVPDQIELLNAVSASAAEVLRGSPRPPTSLVVRAGDVAIEAHWTDPGQGAAGLPQLVVSQPAGDAAGVDVDDAASYICAHLVGVFYRAAQPGAEPFVGEGDVVRAGQQVAIIESMKLLVPVKSDHIGVVVSVLKEDGEPVEFGDRLFHIKAEEG